MESYFKFSLFDSTDFLYSLCFGLMVLVFVAPTTEFITAGVTLENIFYKYLGNESMYFVQYHLRRTLMVRSVFSLFFLLYYVCMHFLSINVSSVAPNLTFPFTIWDVILWIGIAIPVYVLSHNYFVWYAGGTWSGHPTICELKKLLRIELSRDATLDTLHFRLNDLISKINSECRNTNRFIAGHGSLATNWSGRRFLVTNSWILASHCMTFKIIKHSSEDLIAMMSSSLTVLDGSSLNQIGQPNGENMGSQTMVEIKFMQTTTGACLLQFSVPSSNLDELRSKLLCPLIKASGFTLEPTIVQRFIDAFAQVVEENGTIRVSAEIELEQCIGCMTETANVKLVNHDELSLSNASVEPEGNRKCNCRPMWCLNCLARWFASRLIHAEKPPTEWLAGRVPCPTCRAVFCVRDVFLVE